MRYYQQRPLNEKDGQVLGEAADKKLHDLAGNSGAAISMREFWNRAFYEESAKIGTHGQNCVSIRNKMRPMPTSGLTCTLQFTS